MPVRDYERILKFRENNYDEFLELLLEELIRFSNEDEKLLTELISQLEQTEIKDDARLVLQKMRDDKINQILNERS
jgi:predicted RNA binding protein with dsRBD fold (UPF0201 family)